MKQRENTSERAKLTASVQQTLITEETKSALNEIKWFLIRDLQEIQRFALDAVAKRWREGKRTYEELF